MPPLPRLADRLAALAARYDRRWLPSDPVAFPRRHDDPSDREAAAVVAALLAYGRVGSIARSVGAVLGRLGPRPAAALAPGERPRLAERLRGVRHRFTADADLAWLLEGVGRARDEAGSLGAWLSARAAGPQPLRAALSAWADLAHAVPADPDPARQRARRFLLPDPRRGGACKRLLMLARWCVRPDDGVDLGLWTAHGGLAPRDLLVPLDTHVHRLARDLGLTRRAVADWRTAVEVTAALATVDPDDPVRFDFALARPGIAGHCRHRPEETACRPCDLAPCCRHGRRFTT